MGDIISIIIFISLGIIALAAIFSYIRIVPQSEAYVIERLGAYHTTLGVGFHILTPIIDRVAKKISMREQILDFPPQPCITRDNVTIQVDTVIYYYVTDPKLFTYGVDNPISGIEKMTATTIRNIIGELELDETLTSRDTVNSKVREIIDEATDPWGIKVNRVELKNIIPPRDILDAMEKQMRAERERREAILRAEGEKHAAILRAEGDRESALLQADAQRQQMIAIARGEADSILLVAEAQAKGIKMIKEANPSAAYLTLKGFESLEKVADGKATKLIIPSQIQDVAGLMASLKEVLAKEENEEK
ncbi:MAG: SPFH/Band 7/PHB domain protein [Symbiobacteriaceae bacterium]|nr:SPFH/Band 7/PHB domain protein [Symbiobacteriaceae bacterium]